MKPQMQEAEIRLIEQELLAHGGHIDVLEWGSGGSTVYFTKFLRDKGLSYSWLSLEYNKLWYEKIHDATKNDHAVKIALFDVGNTYLKQPDIPMNEYVEYPASLRKKYDVILVDGRKRRRCLIEALKLLKPGGVAILHDARRTYYHCAFRHFPDSRIVLWSGLWVGKLETPSLITKLLNELRYWGFRVYTFSFRLRMV